MQVSCLSLDLLTQAKNPSVLLSEVLPPTSRPCCSLKTSTLCSAVPCSAAQPSASKIDEEQHYHLGSGTGTCYPHFGFTLQHFFKGRAAPR